MPGLSQLKQFNDDILSLGDEISLRSSRGEKPVKIAIPKDVKDENDSEEFVLGMPEKEAPEQISDVEEDFSDLMGMSSPNENKNSQSENPSFDAPDMSSLLSPMNNSDSSEENMPDLSMFMEEEPKTEETIQEKEPEPVSVADLGLDDLLSGAGFDAPEEKTEDEQNLSENNDNSTENNDFNFDDINDIGELDDLEQNTDESQNLENENNFDNSSLDDLENINDLSDKIDIPELNDEKNDFNKSSDDENSTQEEDFSSPKGLFDTSDFEMPETEQNDSSENLSTEGLDDFEKSESENQTKQKDDNSLNLDDIDNLENFDNFDFSTPENESENKEESVEKSDDVFDSIDFGDNFDENNSSENAFSSDFSTNDDENSEEEPSFDENAPIEDFDISEMDGLDFGIPDTDSQLKGENSSQNDDFSFDGDFEIPGFSDIDTLKEEKKSPSSKNKKSQKKNTNIDEADFSGAIEGDSLPPNTLSDSQYKQFLKNFNEYPLNVRLAFENFIVQDEFTDDAEFEIIEKILNKAPARQVANLLEKMLDISIPVPRDYEHRTAQEYEAYKKSLSYQLRNRIIPGCIVCVVVFLAGFGIFKFCQNNIYRPLRANHFYKQGYVLLEQEEFPSAEINFNKAIEYRYNKKWFFKYARGYKNHKQYQRSEKMYENILICFNHDKEAGLEYADLELYDLANYEKAEEIVKRQILDYHINDKDGILKLGDVYLEWGTEKEPEKLELAREQYATLIQLYKSNDLYESRMMRYFICTDNLHKVLISKTRFENREKSLSPDDWIELSGYLLDKSFGEIAPADENLRYQISGLRNLLQTSIKVAPENPIAFYNMSRYYVQTSEDSYIEATLKKTLDCFNKATKLRKKDIYKFLDSYRLLGEYYISTSEYLKAQQQLAEGISFYTSQRDNTGLEGNKKIGKIYEDFANLKYFISGDYDEALQNYRYSVELENDNPSIRYKIGYIQYQKSNYSEALGSFMKAGDGNIKDRNLMQAMANTLSLRGDDYAAQGYYEQLLQNLDDKIAERNLLLPQSNKVDSEIVDMYLKASNNYGVTLYKLAKKTGNSNLNAQSIVQFSDSVRAWDALTRNQTTMTRLGGSNLAEQNIKYINNPIPEFEPAIYIDIKKTIDDKEKF